MVLAINNKSSQQAGKMIVLIFSFIPDFYPWPCKLSPDICLGLCGGYIISSEFHLGFKDILNYGRFEQEKFRLQHLA